MVERGQGLEGRAGKGFWIQWSWSEGHHVWKSELSVLCLFFLGMHGVHVVASDKQGLIGEFCADLGQEFPRTG